MANPDMSIDGLAEILSPIHAGHTNMARAAMKQRLNLIDTWAITPGARVLELGCGQGDCTIALAAAVGTNGHVTAIDPGPTTYGSPWNLGQAQAHIKAGPLGSRITFHCEVAPLDYLRAHAEETWDVAVLAQCIWFFASPAQVLETLSALRGRVERVCISEYALATSRPQAIPHVLAALAQASLECRKPRSESNIRICLSPAAIKKLASEAGLRVEREAYSTPDEDFPNGGWEVNHVSGDAFVREIEDVVADEREKAVVLALRDSVLEGKRRLEGKRVLSMDIWVASFVA